jgi:hypothetical protein
MPGVIVHAYTLSPWQAEARGSEFEARQGYKARLCLKKKKKKTIHILREIFCKLYDLIGV